MDMLQLFTSARQVSVPLLAIRTADQAATVEAIRLAVPDFAVIQWDAARGLTPTGEPLTSGHAPNPAQKSWKLGDAAIKQTGVSRDDSLSFVEAMGAVAKLPRGAICLVHNAHRQMHASEPMAAAANVQSVAVLRDVLKRDFRMLVLMGPSFTPPSELEHDIVVIDHALPGPDELKAIVEELHVAAQKDSPSLPTPTPEQVAKAVDAVSGLSSFAAEQVVAMSLRATGLDLDALWERKRVTIEQAPGLTIWRGKETFKDIVGLEALKTKARQVLRGRTPVGVVVWIDSNRVACAG